MEVIFWSLQLFADGISGDTTAADAGQQSAGENPARAENTQDAAANSTRLTWEQILADPEYNRQIQAVVRARLKAAGSTRRQSVTDPGDDRNTAGGHSVTQPDTVTGQEEASPVQGEVAQSAGGVVQKETIPQSALQTAPFTQGGLARENRQEYMAARLQRYYEGLVQQAEDLQKVFPDFSLPQALRNPDFVRLTAPHVGVSVENAYYLCNRQEHQAMAMALAARKTAEKLSSAVRSGYYRPVENGTAPQAPAVTSFDYAHATAQQRQALKSAIRRSASRGEKLYPEQIR